MSQRKSGEVSSICIWWIRGLRRLGGETVFEVQVECEIVRSGEFGAARRLKTVGIQIRLQTQRSIDCETSQKRLSDIETITQTRASPHYHHNL